MHRCTDAQALCILRTAVQTSSTRPSCACLSEPSSVLNPCWALGDRRSLLRVAALAVLGAKQEAQNASCRSLAWLTRMVALGKIPLRVREGARHARAKRSASQVHASQVHAWQTHGSLNARHARASA
eukprot:970738-Alexandrium_andersonii.AAC.1